MAGARHRSVATLLALAWATLVVYASLFPFNGWRWPPGQGLPSLLMLPWPPWIDLFDLWFNFLGYLPLGALALVAARRSGVPPLGALLLAIFGPSLLSYANEVTQSFLPGRHPSAKDWVTNTAGAFAGAMLGTLLHRLGLIDRWHALRERWFSRRSTGALALLALWPVGLLFPAPVPLGLGQIGDRLRETLVDALEDVPWAEELYTILAEPPGTPHLWAPLEGLATGLGLLAPCLLAFSIVMPGWRRVVLVLGALALAFGGMTLSTLLNFGPQHAFAWLTPITLPALLAGAGFAVLLAPVGSRWAAAFGLVVLGGLVMLVAQAPADPYFAQSLQAWEQGRFARFHGLAQWIGWLWPYGAIGWLVGRLGSKG